MRNNLLSQKVIMVKKINKEKEENVKKNKNLINHRTHLAVLAEVFLAV